MFFRERLEESNKKQIEVLTAIELSALPANCTAPRVLPRRRLDRRRRRTSEIGRLIFGFRENGGEIFRTN